MGKFSSAWFGLLVVLSLLVPWRTEASDPFVDYYPAEIEIYDALVGICEFSSDYAENDTFFRKGRYTVYRSSQDCLVFDQYGREVCRTFIAAVEEKTCRDGSYYTAPIASYPVTPIDSRRDPNIPAGRDVHILLYGHPFTYAIIRQLQGVEIVPLKD